MKTPPSVGRDLPLPLKPPQALMGIMNGGVVDHDSVRNGIDYGTHSTANRKLGRAGIHRDRLPQSLLLTLHLLSELLPLMALGLYQKLTSAEA